MLRKVILMSLFLLLLAACAPASPLAPTPLPKSAQPLPSSAPTSTVQPIAQADAFAFAQNRRLGRGVNFGNALEAPQEGQWGVTLEESFFKIIKGGGFDSIRVPIRWNAHAGEKAPYTVDPAFFERIDWVVQNAGQQNLAVILDWHGYDEMMETSGANKARFLAIWDQIARHYQSAPDSVYFELLNEPNGSLSGTNAWNQILNEAIKTIRASNPERTIVIGPGDWYSINRLNDLQLPKDDRNLILSFHYYQPFHFTHQGAEWAEGSNDWMGTTWTGTAQEQRDINRDLDLAKQWSDQNRRPLYMGEFGAYGKAPMDSRARWTTYLARAAESRGFSWAYWEFCAGFGVYDRATQNWVEPIYKALFP